MAKVAKAGHWDREQTRQAPGSWINPTAERIKRSGLRFGESRSSELLREAADRLNESYWIQGTTATTYANEPDRRRYDLVGAMIAATGFEIREALYEGSQSISLRVSSWAQKPNNYERWSRLIGRRARQGFLRCLAYVTEVTGEIDVDRFNDEVATCKDDVLGALTAAADLAESRGD